LFRQPGRLVTWQVAISGPAARSAAKKLTAESDMPLDAAVVLGLSDTALQVWSADPMLNQVHDHLGHVPLERIIAMQVTPGRQWQKLTIILDAARRSSRRPAEPATPSPTRSSGGATKPSGPRPRSAGCCVAIRIL
jgi:hypothetical protein